MKFIGINGFILIDNVSQQVCNDDFCYKRILGFNLKIMLKRIWVNIEIYQSGLDIIDTSSRLILSVTSTK